MQVQRLSIRKTLSYDLFAMGSYKFGRRSQGVFLLPLHTMSGSLCLCGNAGPGAGADCDHGGGSRKYAAVTGWYSSGQQWLCLVFALMLGENTPIAKLLYHLPPFNLFRGRRAARLRI